MQPIHNLRGIAIVMIVLSHVIYPRLVPEPPGFVHGFIEYYFGSFTIIFMYIAGYIFASQSGSLRYPAYLKSKLLHVGLPYLILSTPAAIALVTGLRRTHEWLDLDWLQGLHPVVAYLYLMATGLMLTPLWFIPMILLYYLAAPAFRLLASRGPLMLGIVCLLVPVADIVNRPAHNDNIVQSALFYLPPYLLGMATYHYRDRLPKPRGAVAAACFAYLAAMAILYGFGFHDEYLVYLPLCLVLLLLMQRYCARHIAWMDLFARLSFFIYFVHGYFVLLYGFRDFFSERVPPLFMAVVPALTPHAQIRELIFIAFNLTVAMTLSIASYIVLKAITGRWSRYLIGG